MPVTRKNEKKFKRKDPDAGKSTSFGGLLHVENLCRRWNIWEIDEKLFPEPLNHQLGSKPAETIIAQLLFSLSRGDTSLGEAAVLKQDPLLLRLVGLKQAADEATLKKWLGAQTESSVEVLRQLNLKLVKALLTDCYSHKTGDEVNPLGIAMRVRKWEGSRNPNSMFDDTRLSIRALAVGPFVMDLSLYLDSIEKHPAEFKKRLTSLRSVWGESGTCFSSNEIPDGEIWNATMESAGFASWTAEAKRDHFEDALNIFNLPEHDWKSMDQKDALTRYCWKYVGPKFKNELPGLATAARGKASSCRFLLMASSTKENDIPGLFARHFSQQRLMDQMLDDLNVHRLILSKDKIPSAEMDNAQAAYFAIASLAYNLIVALRLIHAPQVPGRTVRETVRGVITTPGMVSTSKNYDTLYL